MRISLLVPVYNEEKTLRRSLISWLTQERPFDEIVVVDDSSTDRTPDILQEFKEFVTVVKTRQNSGNKSYAQEYGLQFVTGDIFVATDGDTLLDALFVQEIEKNFQDDATVVAVNGYVKSIPYNWLTACRGLEYAITQNFDKLAQANLNYLFVIPGVAGAFRTDVFKRDITFDHDTITEDLDFTYKLHEREHKIIYNRNAFCYTQDPSTLKAYVNQLRRWYGGGWQNLVKHFRIPEKPGMAFELALVYGEGLLLPLLVFLLPAINLVATLWFVAFYFGLSAVLAVLGAIIEKRADFLLVIPMYNMIRYVNAYIFWEQFILQILFGDKKSGWYKPERVSM